MGGRARNRRPDRARVAKIPVHGGGRQATGLRWGMAPIPPPAARAASDLHLVILAAGRGRRYGARLKQLDPLGPGGAALLDYALADAARERFAGAVVVVHAGLEAALSAHLERVGTGGLPVELVRQEESKLPGTGRGGPGSRRLWGPSHALWAARHAVPGPFVVASADNVYGGGAVARLARRLRSGGRPGSWTLAAYALEWVLSPHGPVNRGLCRLGPDATLEDVVELRGVRRDVEGRIRGLDPEGRERTLSGDARVSTNLWGFTPDVFTVLDRHLADVVVRSGRGAGTESVLPDVVREALARGVARVSVERVDGPCFGVTHPADREGVVERLRGWGRPGVGRPPRPGLSSGPGGGARQRTGPAS